VLAYSSVRLRVTALLAAVPTLAFARAALDGSGDARGVSMLVAVGAFGCDLGAYALALTLRKVAISREAVALLGFRGFALPWEEVDAIEAMRPGQIPGLCFVARDGRRIIGDQGMTGWPELVERLPALVPDRLARAAERAISDARAMTPT
jgi:hypothetical protein